MSICQSNGWTKDWKERIKWMILIYDNSYYSHSNFFSLLVYFQPQRKCKEIQTSATFSSATLIYVLLQLTALWVCFVSHHLSQFFKPVPFSFSLPLFFHLPCDLLQLINNLCISEIWGSEKNMVSATQKFIRFIWSND